MKISLIGVITLLTVIPAVDGSKQSSADLYPEIQKRIEAAKYDERCRQICREMLYLFSQVKK